MKKYLARSLVVFLAVSLAWSRLAAAPQPLTAEEVQRLSAVDASDTLGELQAGQEDSTIRTSLIVVGVLMIVAWIVLGDDEKEEVNFSTLDGNS